MNILFENINEVKKYIAVNVTNNIDTIKPYIYRAQVKFIKTIIGSKLLDELIDYKKENPIGSNNSDANELMSQLLELIQLPLICYAYHLFTPMAQIQLSEGGIHISVNENRKTAFQWQVDMLDRSWLNTAHDFIEEVLEFLDKNINEDVFESYKDSDAYSINKALFINTAKEFNEYVFIKNSMRLFVTLKPIIKSTEEKYIKPTICEALFDEIKEEISGNESVEISADNNKLLKLLRPALSHLTMARAVSELSLDVLPEAITENYSKNNIKLSTPAKTDTLSFYIRQMQHDGEAELKKLQEYLDENASETKYKLYYNSNCYVAQTESYERGEYLNNSDSGICVM